MTTSIERHARTPLFIITPGTTMNDAAIKCKQRSATRLQDILSRGQAWGLNTPRLNARQPEARTGARVAETGEDSAYGVQVMNLHTISVVLTHAFDADLLFDDGTRLKVNGQVFGAGVPFGFSVGLTGYGHFTVPPQELDKFDHRDGVSVVVKTAPGDWEALFSRNGQVVGVIIAVPLVAISADTFIGGGTAGFTLPREWLLIKSYAADLYLNHDASSRALSLSDQRYDPTSGAYDGELWRFEDAGNGKFFIVGHVSGLYLNHQVATQTLELAPHKYDPSSGAYDGTLWERLYTPNGFMIKSPFAELYLNHQISDRYLGLADQKYDPKTGAYDGTLWRLV